MRARSFLRALHDGAAHAERFDEALRFAAMAAVADHVFRDMPAAAIQHAFEFLRDQKDAGLSARMSAFALWGAALGGGAEASRGHGINVATLFMMASRVLLKAAMQSPSPRREMVLAITDELLQESAALLFGDDCASTTDFTAKTLPETTDAAH